jgi:3-oxoacyl-[acyl-carrier protein] reductase
MTGNDIYSSLKGKRVLVTGGSSGIGASISRMFAAKGAKVGIHYNAGKDRAEELKAEITGQGGTAEIFRADFQDAGDIIRLAESFMGVFGGIDVLVNNAGASYNQRAFWELEPDDLERTMSVIIKAPFLLSQKAFSAMKGQGAGGRIINISSISVKYGGSPESLHYTVSKAGLEALTTGLAKIGADHKILVNTIRPGVIDTPFHGRYIKKDMGKRIELIPLKRMGKPEDIANMALYLASEGGNFITGQTFTVSGGD